VGLQVRRLGDHGGWTVELRQRLAERRRPQRPLAVREVLGLVAVREGDVREVDVERRIRRQHLVRAGEDRRERLRLGEAAVGDGVQVREVENGADPAGAGRDGEDVLGRAELPDAAHDLDAEGDRTVLLLQPRAQLPELLDDRVDCRVALAAEQEAGVEDDELGAGCLGDAGGVVEHADGHVQLLAPFRVAHEAGDRCMD